jgi:2-haloacid dehalogenase
MQKPKIIIFDVNETLLDLAPLKKAVAKTLNNQGDLLPLWFSTMLHYSLVETLTENYHNFGEIGAAALVMVAEKQGIELNYQDAISAIIPPLQKLPAHQEVARALKLLSKNGYRLVSLTNSSSEDSEAQLRNAGLIDLFEKRYSIETIRKYKPHPDTYRMIVDDYSVKPEQVMMVAAHAWDLMGAKNVGLQTTFIRRPGATLYPKTPMPDYVVNDLLALTQLEILDKMV